MHDIHESLKNLIKKARIDSDMTVAVISEKLGISERYYYCIESGKNIPSFDLLYKLVHVLSINPESIFYPSKSTTDSEIEDLIRMLYGCDKRSMDIIKATVKAAVESQMNEQSL